MLTGIGSIIGAIAWPGVVLAFVITQREPLQKVLERATGFKAGTVEVSFAAIVEQESATILQQGGSDSAKQVTAAAVNAAERVGELAQRTGASSSARQQMDELAREYERIRATMPRGDTRTRRMEVVVTKMRTLAVAALPSLQEFMHSAQPGDRLAAIVVLQVSPNLRYVDWLADRVRAEKPFVGYHAAVALLTAARLAGPADREAVEAAVRKANTVPGPEGNDRQQVLNTALRELEAIGA